MRNQRRNRELVGQAARRAPPDEFIEPRHLRHRPGGGIADVEGALGIMSNAETLGCDFELVGHDGGQRYPDFMVVVATTAEALKATIGFIA